MIPLLVITFINKAIVIRIKTSVHEFYGTVFASSIRKWGSTESEKKKEKKRPTIMEQEAGIC